MPSAPSTAGTFRVQILGPFIVERDGMPLDMARWQRRIARLFKLLAVAPHHRRSRDELIGTLWPDASEEAAGANLRLVLHRLRQVLGDRTAAGKAMPSPIISEHGWVALNPAYSWQVDYDRFTQLAADAGDEVEQLEEAAALYQGEALEDEAYEDWALPYREQAARHWRDVCLRLATQYRSRGSAERAVEWLERLLEADPLDEEALRELLITLETLTRETEALRRFHRFERLLAEELDVPPDAETLAVAARVAEHLRQSEVAIPVAPEAVKPAVRPVVPSYPLSVAVPLIGRQRELDLIADTLLAAGHTPRLLLLAAEAGTGKTRILAEAAVRARQDGVLTLAGGSYEQEGHLPYGPIHDALLDYVLTQSEDLLHSQLEGTFSELARVVPELRLRVGSLQREWAGDADNLRLRLFSAVAQALGRIAEDRSVLLLLDDLHWSDESTLQLLHYLLRQPYLSRLLVIGAYRQEDVGVDTPLARWLGELTDDESLSVRSHSLASLSEAEIRALLEERLRGPCSETLGCTLYERSAGNPFFALQMLRLLQQEDRLELSIGGWRLTTQGRAEENLGTLLPVKVRRTVSRRLQRLDRVEHESVAVGAVLGREFSYAAVEALWDGEQSDLFQGLEGAVNAYLLSETESGFAFRHPMLREVAYDEIPVHRRVRLHRRAGWYLHDVYGPPDSKVEPQHTVQLAWHFLQGEEPEQALSYALLAGDQAQGAFAHRQAESHYRTALDLAQRLGNAGARLRSLEQLGGVLVLLGRFEEAEPVLEQAAAGYAAENDLEGQRRVVGQMGQLHFRAGSLERGIDRLTQALHSLDSVTPSSGLAELHLALALLFFRTGRYREQLEAAELAINVAAAVGDNLLLSQARLMRAYSLPWLGTAADFRHGLEEVAAFAEEIQDLPTLARALCALADPYTAMGEHERAQETLVRAMDLAERVGDLSRIAFTANMCGLAAYRRGEWAEAERHFRRSLGIYRELNALPDTMIPLFGLGALHMDRGDWSQGQAALHDHIALAHQTGDFRWLHSAEILLAEHDLLEGRPEDALARLESVVHLPGLSDMARTALLPPLARTHLELGEVDRATDIAIQAGERAQEEDDREGVIEALWVQGMALTRRHRFDEAEMCFRRALHLLDETPFRYDRARVLLAWGSALSDRGEAGEARSKLQEALDIFQELGARPYIEKTREGLTRLKATGSSGQP